MSSKNSYRSSRSGSSRSSKILRYRYRYLIIIVSFPIDDTLPIDAGVNPEVWLNLESSKVQMDAAISGAKVADVYHQGKRSSSMHDAVIPFFHTSSVSFIRPPLFHFSSSPLTLLFVIHFITHPSFLLKLSLRLRESSYGLCIILYLSDVNISHLPQFRFVLLPFSNVCRTTFFLICSLL